MTDHDAMTQCLALAMLGEGTTSPNPLVGCLVVKDGAVVGTGFHRAPGRAHAEIAALAEAGPRARGASLYVNLEPCAHHGRTPPCVEAIIGAGIARVIAGTRDPNPLVDGRGFDRLRGAGIEVQIGLLERACRAVNASFLSAHERRRPWVTAKAAQSWDGQIAAAGGSSTWVTGEPARRFAHRLRFRHDAVLVGGATVRRDDPRLTVRLPKTRAPRLRVVLSRSSDLDPAARIFARDDAAAPRTRVYLPAAAGGRRCEALARVADVVPVESREGGVSLPAMLRDLAALGVQSLLVEGGGRTLASFLEANLVDELALFVAPRLIGARDATPLADLAAAASPDRAHRLVVRAVVPLGVDRLVLARVGAA